MLFRWAVVAGAYSVLYLGCFVAAFCLRLDFELYVPVRELIWRSLPVLLICKLIGFTLAGEWRRSFRHGGLPDVIHTVAGVCAGSFLYYLAIQVGLSAKIPRTVHLIDLVLTLGCCGGLRIAYRVVRESLRLRASQNLALVFGTQEEAATMIRSLSSKGCQFRVVGVISDSPKHSLRGHVAGLPALSHGDNWERFAARFEAEHLLVSAATPGKTLREILHRCAACGIKTHVIPDIQEIMRGKFRIAPRDITINDLLRREPAQLDNHRIGQFLTGQTVLVTGGAGSVGSELCRQILPFRPAKLVIVDQCEFGVFQIQQELAEGENSDTEFVYEIGDVLNAQRMTKIFEAHRPKIVFHAAAYKHVPLMEDNPQEAIRNNVFGTKTVIDVAIASGVERFVMISTDKAVRPTNVMGATKLTAEQYLHAMSGDSEMDCIAVRFGNVLNSAGSVVPTFRRQIEQGGPITVTHPDMERFFMTIPEAAQLVLQAGAIGESGDLMILDMGEPARIVDLARDMIKLSGLRYPEDIDIVFTGLRPGEKMKEELMYRSEHDSQKIHEKIYCVRREPLSKWQIHGELSQLDKATKQSPQAAVRELWRLVELFVAHQDGVQVGNQAAA